MRKPSALCVLALAALAAASAASGAVEATGAVAGAATTPAACTTPQPVVHYTWIHCYTAPQIRAAYGVDGLGLYGKGQTIVLVDSYGEPTGAQDLQKFHDTFF